MGDFLAGGRRLWVCESKITVALTATEERVTQSDGEANSRVVHDNAGAKRLRGRRRGSFPLVQEKFSPFTRTEPLPPNTPSSSSTRLCDGGAFKRQPS